MNIRSPSCECSSFIRFGFHAAPATARLFLLIFLLFRVRACIQLLQLLLLLLLLFHQLW
jgi:hypothetical protein